MEETNLKQPKQELKKQKKELLNIIQEEKQLKEEYLNDLKRIQADFENYQKRIEKEKIEFIKYAKKDLLLKLLEILDNFEKANINDEGVNLILKQLRLILEKEGIKEINELYFNPEKHEVISLEEGEENKILEQYQKGYMLHDKVIRSSKVKVGKGGNKNEQSKP